jgi:hypothetical protein
MRICDVAHEVQKLAWPAASVPFGPSRRKLCYSLTRGKELSFEGVSCVSSVALAVEGVVVVRSRGCPHLIEQLP